MVRGVTSLALPIAVGLGCASTPPSAPPSPKAAVHLEPAPPPPAWTYWEPVDVPAGPSSSAAAPLEAPLNLALVERTPGVEARWATAPAALKEALASRGFVVSRAAHPVARLGDFYAALRDDRVAWVLSLDVLFFLTHLAVDRAVADVEASVVAPALATMLRRLELRLGAESRAAHADMTPAYTVARGLVAVALALVQAGYRAPAELAAFVDGERARVLGHSGIGTSPWFGTPIDYSAMSPRGAADRDEAHAGWFRAVAWLDGTALALEGRGEGAVHAPVDVATARTHARAALLLSRLLDYGVDAEAASAWQRAESASELLVGEADDPTPQRLALAAASQKLDLRSGDWLSNVALVDRVRHSAAEARRAQIDDGALGLTAPAGGSGPALAPGRLAPGFRLLGPRATPDGELLQSLVFPLVGALSRTEPPPTARDGVRALPTALDVAAWLGSDEARAQLHATGDDAYARYGPTLERLARARPPEGSVERHRTPYVSMLDAIETWLGASSGDRVHAGASSTEWRARKAEVALAAWTELRHDASAMARVQAVGVRLAPRAAAQPVVPIFVEAHPEAIAKLVAVVRQTERALLAAGALAKDSPSVAVLDEVDDLLRTAFEVAVDEALDRPVPPARAGALAAFPARLRALEGSLDPSGAVDVPLVVDVHTDRPAGRVLEEALGRIEELWTVVREPQTHRLWIALGAAIPRHELVASAHKRSSDATWRARIAADGEPPPGDLAKIYTATP
jgi:hypothetical protein